MASLDIIVESGVASAILDTVAPKDSPTFSGNVFLPSTTTIGSVSSTEISYLDGLTANIQSQINGISVTDPITGNIYLPVMSGTAGSIVFEGSNADDYELTLSPGSGPSSDVTVVIPADVSTTLVGIDNVQTLKNKTFQYPNQVYAGLTGYTSTATAGGTTTFTATSTNYQIFTGTSNQKVRLPLTSSLVIGQTFHIVNNTTSNTISVITNQTSPEISVIDIPAGTTAMVTCISIAGANTAAEWESGITDFSTYTGTGSVVLSNSPTLTLPTTIGTTGSPTTPTFSGIFTVPYSSSTSGIKNVVGAPITPTYWTQNTSDKSLGLVSLSTNYPIFTNSTLTLRPDTLYKFECYVQLTASGTLTGTTTSFDLIGTGNLTGATISYTALSTAGTTLTNISTTPSFAKYATSGPNQIIASVTTNFVRSATISGFIRIPAGTTTLNITPSVYFSATQGSITQSVVAGSYISLNPIGTYSDVQAGGWS